MKSAKILRNEQHVGTLTKLKESAGDDYKYESSYEECANGIQRFVAAHIPAIEDFYKRIILNYLISNGDAHLKNFSLIREAERPDYSLSLNYDILFTKYHLPEENGIAGLDLFKEYETEAFGAMGYYTLQDFEEFAKMIDIPDRRLIKIFNDILLSTDKVYKLIEQSYLSPEAKTAYAQNYKIRLENCLCYSIKSYSFKGITQDIIEKVLLKKQ